MTADHKALREDLAMAARVLHRLELTDLMDHVSARVDGTDFIAVSPRMSSGTCSPHRLAADDIVLIDMEGEVVEGSHEPPWDIYADIEVYRARPDVGAVVYASPEATLAHGISRQNVSPLTHTESAIVHRGIATHEMQGLIVSAERGRNLVRSLGHSGACQLPGLGVIHVGDSLLSALRQCHMLEYLAQISLIAASLGSNPRLVTQEEAEHVLEEAEHVLAQLPADKKQLPRGPRRRYESYDDPSSITRRSWAERLPAPSSEVERIKQELAVACRVLDREKTLVSFFEHVSHRFPGMSDRFLMTPAKNFGEMEPADVGVIGMEGDCEWLAGPFPPAPFRWYQRDIFRTRPDVKAAVHTHDMYGRAFVTSGVELLPVFRNGALMANQDRPIFPEPSSVFADEDRAKAMDLLGDKSEIHLLAHGSDFLRESLQAAIVDAIHREQAYRLQYKATLTGEPLGVSDGVIADVAKYGPSPEEWWDYYVSHVE